MDPTGDSVTEAWEVKTAMTMQRIVTSPARVRSHMPLLSLSHAPCALQVHQVQDMDDLQALATTIGVAIHREDRHRSRGREHVCKRQIRSTGS